MLKNVPLKIPIPEKMAELSMTVQQKNVISLTVVQSDAVEQSTTDLQRIVNLPTVPVNMVEQ